MNEKPAPTQGAVSFSLQDVHCPRCAEAIEQTLRAHPAITQVDLDWPNNVVHVRYRQDLIRAQAIEHLITGTGCQCAPTPEAAPATAGSSAGPAAPHADHAADPP